jgi:predicted nucleic acid-binding protein
VKAAGRSPRPRLPDLLIAATAVANGLPLYTRNPADFAGLRQILLAAAVRQVIRSSGLP